MTRLLLISLLSIFTFSCQDDQEPYNEYPQTWKISGYRVFGFGGDSGFQVISDSSYTYLFKKDGTYIKTVGEESTSGTYETEFKIYDVGGERKEYVLIFEEDILRHSCSANREYLFIDENEMLVGGSAPCDGPSLYFSLVK